MNAARAIRSRACAAVLAAFLTALAPAAAPAAETADSVIGRLAVKYGPLKTLTASFEQEFKAAGAGEGRVSSGTVYLKKPGKMRWAYSAPQKDELVSDGATIWFYQADINQVVERPAPSTGRIASDLLSGVGDLKKDFNVRLAADAEAGGKAAGKAKVLELTPKDEGAGFRRLFIAVDDGTSLIVRTTVEDAFGNRTAVSYTDIRTDAELKDSLFRFKAPKGAAVMK